MYLFLTNTVCTYCLFIFNKLKQLDIKIPIFWTLKQIRQTKNKIMFEHHNLSPNLSLISHQLNCKQDKYQNKLSRKDLIDFSMMIQYNQSPIFKFKN